MPIYPRLIIHFLSPMKTVNLIFSTPIGSMKRVRMLIYLSSMLVFMSMTVPMAFVSSGLMPTKIRKISRV